MCVIGRGLHADWRSSAIAPPIRVSTVSPSQSGIPAVVRVGPRLPPLKASELSAGVRRTAAKVCKNDYGETNGADASMLTKHHPGAG